MLNPAAWTHTSVAVRDAAWGIGLALVRLVTAQHGGTVQVSDAPSGGALFLVRLPVATPAVAAERAAHA